MKNEHLHDFSRNGLKAINTVEFNECECSDNCKNQTSVMKYKNSFNGSTTREMHVCTTCDGQIGKKDNILNMETFSHPYE